jgi:hypothetical protein
MKSGLFLALACVLTSPGVAADEPAAPDKPAVCPLLNQRILGPRSDDRPLPLLAGNPARGFRPACSAPWSALSPNNQPLKIVDCFRGSLLQFANEAACGRDTGPLWVSARWVITTADKQPAQTRAATCQQLETGALAATRDFGLDCVPQKKELPPKAESTQHTAAPAAEPATPPASTPHPGP